MTTCAARASILCFITFYSEEPKDATRTRYSTATGICSRIPMFARLVSTRCCTICSWRRRRSRSPPSIRHRLVSCKQFRRLGRRPQSAKSLLANGAFEGRAPNSGTLQNAGVRCGLVIGNPEVTANSFGSSSASKTVVYPVGAM
jgi:hypothetical protein